MSNNQFKHKKAKKVLVVSTIDLTPYCFLRTKFKAMTEAGYDVTLACSVQKFRKELEETGITLIDLPIARRISPAQDLVSFLKLIRLILKIKPDIVHTHTSKAGFIGRLAAFLCRVPLRLHTIHELPENSTSSRIIKYIYSTLEFAAARFAHFHFTVSSQNFKQIVSEGICSQNKLAIVREGCPGPEKFIPAGSHAKLCKKLNFPEDSLIIGTVGRLEKAKGHQYLIEAFSLLLKKVPQELSERLRLVITGQGELKADLEQQIKNLNLQGRAVLVGWAENLNEYLSNYDIYALASLYEGLGIANMEAMALKRPVICTGVGGVLDVIDNEINGLLVPPANSEAMAQALARVCQNPELAQKLAENGYKKVASEFNELDNCRKLLNYYEELYRQYAR